VDGKTSPHFFEENGCTHTDYATDPWWRVDLGTSLPVAEVVIVNRECGSCGAYLSGFEIRIGQTYFFGIRGSTSLLSTFDSYDGKRVCHSLVFREGV